MSDAEKQMEILAPTPIKVILAGKEVEVQKMTVRKQFVVGGIFQEEIGGTETEALAERMLRVISIATNIQMDTLDANCDMVEIRDAFQAIWKQNNFDRFQAQPADKA